MSRPRTGQDFDELGDVWNVGSPDDRARLEETMRFVARHVRRPRVLVECGPLQGEISGLLLQTFPRARLHLVEIASSHAAALRERFADVDRVVVHESDMLELEQLPVQPADAVLLIECLYYLAEPERRRFVETLRRVHPKARVVVAAPVDGGPYFTEETLLELFDGYRVVDRGIVDGGHGLFAFAPRRWPRR